VTEGPIITAAQLREIYPQPAQRALDKQRDRLDHHCRSFIASSPFVLVATAGADGSCDVSPRGGPPGFVSVLDDGSVRIPDARGNRRLDSLGNVLENPHAGLLFLIPGMGETLRVNGTGSITHDEGSGAVWLVVTAEEVFLHCAKALIRSKLWDQQSWPASSELPSAATIFGDHMSLGDEGAAAMLAESYTSRLE
jgi:uncharacterized protein